MATVETPVNIGVDIGQQRDPTAIIVSEAIQRPQKDASGALRVKHVAAQLANDIYFEAYDKPLLETAFIVRFMERVALGTDYPKIAERIAMICSGAVISKRPRRLLMDVTGVGRPVFDLVRQIVRADENNVHNVTIKAVTFTHGEKYDPTTGMLGKAYLVSLLQALLQRQGIQLPAAHPDAQQMMRELLDYQIKIDPATANDTYGAFKVGQHDDYVTALGLSVIDDPWKNTATMGPRLF